MGRLIDTLMEWLMRPRVRRVRRWSFVATVPGGLLVAHVYGLHGGVAVVAGRIALWGLVAIAAWRLGGDRGEALRDLLMHPRLRAFGRAELDILTAVPRLLLVRAEGSSRDGLGYTRGTFGLALALAFTPVIVSEALALHLLLSGGWVAWVLDALHGYMLLWLWGFALGPLAYPHRVGARAVVLRGGPMYRVLVPRSTIVSATVRCERIGGERGLVNRDSAVLLPVRGRIDVWLELSEPVRVQRPMHEPLETRHLGVASDDPERLIGQLLAPMSAPKSTHDVYGFDVGLGLLGALDVAGLARDTIQAG